MTAGVDAALFRPESPSARPRLGLPGEAPVALFAGRLVPLKNIPLLVEIFASLRAQVPGSRLVVAGEGPLRSDLVARAARAGLRCATPPDPGDLLLAGEVPHEAMPAYYAAADLLLLASVNESFSLVALEAMACGIPVVAPRVGYLPRLVEDGVTGHLYGPGDAREGARKAAALLLDPEARRREGAAARERALARHSWDAVAADFAGLYRDLLAP
jgi:D-inositol-3-phosphate glycosyltransferase